MTEKIINMSLIHPTERKYRSERLEEGEERRQGDDGIHRHQVFSFSLLEPMIEVENYLRNCRTNQ